MKYSRRALFWVVFFAMVGVVAALPEFMGSSVPAVAPVVRAKAPAAHRADTLLPSPAAPLATLRSPSISDSAPAVDADTPMAEATTEPAKPATPDLFAAKTWVVPPPPPPPAPPPAPPPPPSAPPLPFRLLGKLDDAANVKAFLQKGEQVYTVSVGDVIDGTYRVDSIKTGQMTLIYLPLSTPQTLTGGGES